MRTLNSNQVYPALPLELSSILATSLLGGVPLVWLPALEIPEPYRQLLVHDHDMTSELAGFHGDSIALHVLQSRQSNDTYFREVTLHTDNAQKTVEYGLIEILLDSFPTEHRPLILAADTPLGAILTSSGLPFRSEPQGYFSVPAAALDTVFPETAPGATLYGRYNHILDLESNCLARILEILPA